VLAPELTASPQAEPAVRAKDSSAPPGADFAAFDQDLVERLVGRGALGVSIAVAVDGSVVHTAAYGVANEVTGEPLTPSHRLRLASVSKIVTAVATLQLVERGAIGLDDPVGERLASALGVQLTEPKVAYITVRHLLNHTSGFPAYERTFFGGLVPTCQEAAKRGLGRGLLAAPGAEYHYANMNYCVLGILIEQLTGMPYERAVSEMLLTPLGVASMRLAGTEDVRPGDAAQPTTPTRRYMEALGGAGAWVGTAADLVRVVTSLDPFQATWMPVTAATAELARQPAPVEYALDDRWYGMGLIVHADGSWGHTGTLEGARAAVFHRPDGISWAVMVSGNVPNETDRLVDYVNRALAVAGLTA
jgi:D-alanyl-D-alanine carboxypeptidase